MELHFSTRPCVLYSKHENIIYELLLDIYQAGTSPFYYNPPGIYGQMLHDLIFLLKLYIHFWVYSDSKTIVTLTKDCSVKEIYAQKFKWLFPARTRLINYSTSNSGLRKLGTSTISMIKKEIICLGFPLFFSSMQFFSVTQILSIYIKGIKRRVRQSLFDSIQHKTWYFLIENYKTFCVWYIHTYIYILDFAKKSSTK